MDGKTCPCVKVWCLLICCLSFQRDTHGCSDRRNLTMPNGTFQSPTYPGLYKGRTSDCTTQSYGNTDCRKYSYCVSCKSWTITVEDFKIIRLTFSNFYFPMEHNWCCPSHLEVWEGSDKSGTRLAGLCDVRIPDPVTSTGNQLYIEMAATTKTKGVSFEASWTSECKTKILEGNSGTIESPNYPRHLGEIGECRWVISVTSDRVIEFTFEAIALGKLPGQGGPGCNTASAHVALYDSYTVQENNLIRRYCTRNEVVDNITTTGNHLTVILVANGPDHRHFNEHGFRATYVSKEKSSVIRKQKGLFIFDRSRHGGNNIISANQESSECLRLGEGSNSDDAGMPVGDYSAKYAQVHAKGKISFHRHRLCGPSSEVGYVSVYETDIDNSIVNDVRGILYDVYTPKLCSSNSRPNEKTHCRRANEDVLEYTGKAFTSKLVLSALWDSVRHKRYSGNATFQAVIASDGKVTYALTYYQHNSMEWKTDATPEIAVGFGRLLKNNRTQHVKEPISNTKKLLNIDKFAGSAGRLGTWIFTLGSTNQTNPDSECDEWYKRNSLQSLKEARKSGFDLLPTCPCRRWFIEVHADWVQSPSQERPGLDCFRLSRARSSDFFPYGKFCCYRGNSSVADIPDAGSATAFNPSYPSLVTDYDREDRRAYNVCCKQSESCDKYFELRPASKCSDVRKRFSWLCCDPYITTLDEKGYLFNGWGEYILVTLNTNAVTFTLQGRTDRPETESGKIANATVFTAFGAQENGVNVFVGLDAEDMSSLIIYAQGTDYSLQFRSPTFLVDEQNFMLSKVNEDLAVAFPSGISLTVSVRTKSLAVSLGLPLTFESQTRGLLGNFNGNQDDEFILPNGTVLRSDLTEREIFHNFGQKWRVAPGNSVMRYGKRESPADYDHPEFVPAFLDEQPPSVRQEAEGVCGSSNIACINDYFATRSSIFALDSKVFTNEAERTNEIAKNTVPQLEVPLRLNVTSGVSTTFTVQGHDLNDTLSYHPVNDVNGMISVDSSTGQVTYTPDSSRPATLSFYAVDSHNVQSPVRVVPVVICSGCSDHGTCDFSISSYGETGHHNFQFALCVCEPAWDGPDCERDRDGCFGFPCMPQQTCTDLTPEQQGQSQVGYDCGPCPSGYTQIQGSENCLDIDECADASTNDCDSNSYCYNTIGSYECACYAGYRSDDNGRTCWDIDECQEKTHNCQQICNNTAGNYTCLCEEGYTLDGSGTTCSQDASTTSICSAAGCSKGCKSVLDSTTGSTIPECFCFSGYDLDPTDSKTCQDHDECEDDICDQNCFNYGGGFVCFCESGYRLSEDKSTCEPCPPLRYGRECELTCTCSGRLQGCHPVKGCICEDGWTGNLCQDDVNECLENRTICSNDQICVNTLGSYECSCQDGYEKDASGTCEDVDECAEGSPLNTCGELEQCVNIPGDFYCTCIAGYQENNGACVDVDECADGKHKCEQRCDNVLGTYNCDCYYGYRLRTDRVSCTKVSTSASDACSSLNCDHGCTLSDDDDSAVCFCRAGYQLIDQETCNDINECSAGTSGCSDTCDNTDGGFLCSCPLGMKLDNDGKTCLDCPAGTYGADCARTCACGLGSERCDVITGCVCKMGWQGEKCVDDVNECDRTNVQQECREKNAQCENYPGGYKCLCRDGYQENSTGVCGDIDECSTDVCDQQCENSPGSYRCLCNRGFTLDLDKGLCKDIDECLLSVFNNCTQRCINSAGSYKCTCDKSGYVIDSDGVTCIATGACARTDCPTQNGGCSNEQCFCNSGYELTAGNNCELADVDWCVVAECDHLCQVTPNRDAFICSCRRGYFLQADRTSCLECPRGRYGEGCSSTCTCDMQNTLSCNTETGACTCTAGWEGSSCSDDIDECDSGVACPENSQCANTAGSYSCVCGDGYVMDSSGNCTANGSNGHVNITITISDISVDSADISDVTSTSFLLWAEAASDALDKKLRPKVKGFRSVNILGLRVGSLIVETDIVLDQASHPDALATLSLALLDLAGDSLTVNGQTGTVGVSVNNGDVDDSWTPCDMYTAIRPCSETEDCVSTGQLPECRHVESPSSPAKTNILIIIIPATVILTGLLIPIIVIIVKKKNRPAKAVGTYVQEDDTKPASSSSNSDVRVTNSAPENNYAPLSLVFSPPRYSTANILDNLPRPLYEMTEHPYARLGASQEGPPVSRPTSAASYVSVNGWTDGLDFGETGAEETYQKPSG